MTGSDGSQYGKFTVEPLERGFGTTIGNALRRVLLSSLEGTAVTSCRIEGITHEYTAIPGVLEDVIDVMLNLKGLAVKTDSKDPEGYSVSEVKVNGESFALTQNQSGNCDEGEYWIGYEGKDVYLQSAEAGLIEVIVTKAN